MTGGASWSMRAYLSTRLLWTAEHHAVLAAAIEAEYTPGDARFDIELNAHVLSGVFASVGFLEAAINELFQDAADGHGETIDGYIAPLSPETRKLMRQWWAATDNGEHAKMLGKYRAILDFADRPALNARAEPWQSAAALTKLRNALVHFRPETLPRSITGPHPMESLLHARFAPCKLLAGSGNPWWPDHCLGAGCAQWAHDSARALAERVATDIGVDLNFMRMRRNGGYGRAPGREPA